MLPDDAKDDAFVVAERLRRERAAFVDPPAPLSVARRGLPPRDSDAPMTYCAPPITRCTPPSSSAGTAR